jgi:hypothetical protein
MKRKRLLQQQAMEDSLFVRVRRDSSFVEEMKARWNQPEE